MTEKQLTSLELAYVHMISSFLQITISLPFSHPIDTTKSRIQTRVYNGTMFNILKQIKNNGVFSMYKGYTAMYLNLILKQPAKLAVYEHIKDPLCAGLATGFTGLFVGIPMSYIKTNYQVNPEFKIKDLFKLGFSGFAKSFVAWKYEACKEITGNTAFYGLYKVLNNVRKSDDHNEITITHRIFSGILNRITTNVDEQRKIATHSENGAIAGFLGTYVSYPIDTMKSHKQTRNQTGNFKMIFNEVYYRTQIAPENLNTFKHVHWYLNPSYSNFWRGVSITATKHGVIGGIGMMLYESIKPHVKTYFLDNK